MVQNKKPVVISLFFEIATGFDDNCGVPIIKSTH